MFFTTATYVDGPAAVDATAAQIGQTEVIKAKHATNLIVDNIY
jgi:hypothetical protein